MCFRKNSVKKKKKRKKSCTRLSEPSAFSSAICLGCHDKNMALQVKPYWDGPVDGTALV